MRAAVLHAPGPPTAFQLEDIELPPLGRHEVCVRVERCGVSSRDVVERNGTYRRDVSFPLVIGLEIAGVVTETGDAVDPALTPGTRVCTKAFSSCGECRLCRMDRESTCLNRRPVRGGYGQFTNLDADAVVAIPDRLSYDQACSLGPAAGVALNAVRDTAHVMIGDTVLVTGASGGVGSAAVQLAHLAGARVIALTRDADKVPALYEDGADEVVVGIDTSRAVREIRGLTGGSGVDVVIDTVGSAVFELCFDALALHGRYAFVGELHGNEVGINPARIFFKRAALLGVGSVSRAQLQDVVELAARGILRTRIAVVLPLDQVAKAHTLVETSAVTGRVLLDPQARAEAGGA